MCTVKRLKNYENLQIYPKGQANPDNWRSGLAASGQVEFLL